MLDEPTRAHLGVVVPFWPLGDEFTSKICLESFSVLEADIWDGVVVGDVLSAGIVSFAFLGMRRDFCGRVLV